MATNLVDNHDEGRWCIILLGPDVSMSFVRKQCAKQNVLWGCNMGN